MCALLLTRTITRPPDMLTCVCPAADQEDHQPSFVATAAVLDESRRTCADLLNALACVRHANQLLSRHELSPAQLTSVREFLGTVAARAATLAKAADRAARRTTGAMP